MAIKLWRLSDLDEFVSRQGAKRSKGTKGKLSLRLCFSLRLGVKQTLGYKEVNLSNPLTRDFSVGLPP
jgi:hypothetical protein